MKTERYQEMRLTCEVCERKQKHIGVTYGLALASARDAGWAYFNTPEQHWLCGDCYREFRRQQAEVNK